MAITQHNGRFRRVAAGLAGNTFPSFCAQNNLRRISAPMAKNRAQAFAETKFFVLSVIFIISISM